MSREQKKQHGGPVMNRNALPGDFAFPSPA